MLKEKKPQIEEGKLGPNPFVLNLRIPVNKIVMSGQWKSDKDGVVLPVEVELEKDPICKVYVDAARRKQMIELTPRAKDLLMWVIYEVENGKDWMWLNKTRYMEECKVKAYNTFKEAIRELVSNGFMQPTMYQGVYWINPHFFFNGSRVHRFPQNVVRK